MPTKNRSNLQSVDNKQLKNVDTTPSKILLSAQKATSPLLHHREEIEPMSRKSCIEAETSFVATCSRLGEEKEMVKTVRDGMSPINNSDIPTGFLYRKVRESECYEKKKMRKHKVNTKKTPIVSIDLGFTYIPWRNTEIKKEVRKKTTLASLQNKKEFASASSHPCVKAETSACSNLVEGSSVEHMQRVDPTLIPKVPIQSSLIDPDDMPFFLPEFLSKPQTLTEKHVKIRKQIEYYFCEFKTGRDTYLKEHMDSAGWVDIDLISQFPMLKIITDNIMDIKAAMEMSLQVKMSPDRFKLKSISVDQEMVLLQ